MKQTGKCPKCSSQEVVRKKGSSLLNSWSRISISLTSLDVWVTKYICTECGFIEEWVDDPGGLAKLKANL
ncbi:MAG: hypothetical protein GY765_14030 [bacterium]|nr:hypothetical protein [bacterium]